MLTTSKVRSVEYYIDAATQAERDQLTYYTDQDAAEAAGEWYVRGCASGLESGLGVKSGQKVTDRSIRMLAGGKHGRTGENLIQRVNEKRTAGYDLTFSAPKSVSALRAIALVDGRDKVAAKIDAAHDAAVKATIDAIYDLGYVEARRGKNGYIKEAAQEIAVAMYRHQTSRAGDPQLHTHAVLMNVCVRQDGSTGTFDNTAILSRKKYFGAIYRAELAKQIVALGVGLERDASAWKIAGIPDELIKDWSKRTDSIEEHVAATVGENATDEQKKLATLQTRESKKLVPSVAELKSTWKEEIKQVGGAKVVIDRVKGATETLQREYAKMDQRDLDAIRADRAVREIHEALKTDSVLTLRTAREKALVGMAEFGDMKAAHQVVDHLVEQGALMQIGVDGHTLDGLFTTREMLKMERELAGGIDFNRAPDRRHLVDEIDTGHMSDEQVAAVKHAFSGSSVVVIEGAAGSGKSVSMRPVADIYRGLGQQVFAAAPTAKAAGGLANEIDADGQTLAKMLLTDLRGVNEGDAIILDEAGMVGTADMHELVTKAQARGANLILAGDRNQLQSISAGSALRLVAQGEGVAQISKIRRQKVEWQREASQAFFEGDAKRGLGAYMDHMKVKWADGRDEVIERLATDWQKFTEENPSKTNLVIANKNDDVDQLNQILRQKSIEAGRLGAEEITVDAVQGRGAAPMPLALSDGDRLLFRKNIKVADQSVSNGDFATISGIRREGEQTFLKVALDKGIELEAPLDAFRDQEGALNMRHGYAATNYSAQGATVDQTFGLYQQGMKAESMYVMSTRHRDDFQLYVDRQEIERAAEAQEGFELAVGGGRAELGHEARDMTGEFTQDHLNAMILNSVAQKDTKKNASDYLTAEELHQGKPSPAHQAEFAAAAAERAARVPEPERQVELQNTGPDLDQLKAEMIELAEKGPYPVSEERNLTPLSMDISTEAIPYSGRSQRLLDRFEEAERRLDPVQTLDTKTSDERLEQFSRDPAYQPPWSLSDAQTREVRAFLASKGDGQAPIENRGLNADEKARLDAWRQSRAAGTTKASDDKPQVSFEEIRARRSQVFGQEIEVPGDQALPRSESPALSLSPAEMQAKAENEANVRARAKALAEEGRRRAEAEAEAGRQRAEAEAEAGRRRAAQEAAVGGHRADVEAEDGRRRAEEEEHKGIGFSR